jgi:hypothetical protein
MEVDNSARRWQYRVSKLRYRGREHPTGHRLQFLEADDPETAEEVVQERGSRGAGGRGD